MSPLLHITGLDLSRGRFRLSIPSFALQPGRVLGVVGPNGAGKTSLLGALAGLWPVDTGTVSVLGLDPWKEQAALRQQVGFMSDDLPLFPMRIDRLLRLVSGYYPRWDRVLAADLLDRFALDPRAHVRTLSRGGGTRLRLLLALAIRPRLLILDEPAAGLDLSARRTLLEQVLAVARDPQRAVILSSHGLEDVERIADELLVLAEGRVVRQGATEGLLGEERTLEEALLAWGAA